MNKFYIILSILISLCAAFWIFSVIFHAHPHQFAFIGQNALEGNNCKFDVNYGFVADTKMRVLRATNKGEYKYRRRSSGDRRKSTSTRRRQKSSSRRSEATKERRYNQNQRRKSSNGAIDSERRRVSGNERRERSETRRDRRPSAGRRPSGTADRERRPSGKRPSAGADGERHASRRRRSREATREKRPSESAKKYPSSPRGRDPSPHNRGRSYGRRQSRGKSRGAKSGRSKSAGPYERRKITASKTKDKSPRHQKSSTREKEYANKPCRSYDKICGFGENAVNVNDMREMHEFDDRYCVATESFAHGAQGSIFVAYSKKYNQCAAYKLVWLNKGRLQKASKNESMIIEHLKAVNKARMEGNKLKRIIHIYENEERSEAIHMIMDLGETNLENYFKNKIDKLNGEEKLREIERLIAGILNAMIELHAAGVMHLDFKLENAILMPSEHNANVKSVKIIDFGGARKINSYFNERRNINEEIRIAGRIFTKIYGSPEIVSIDMISTKSDIWSIGVIIVELLTNMELNVNKVAILKRVDGHWTSPKMQFTQFRERFYAKMGKLWNLILPYYKGQDANYERIWRLGLGCLRFEPKVRPMALQLLAYMNDWCILSVPSIFADFINEKSYRGSRKSSSRSGGRLPMCYEISDVDYSEKVQSRTLSGARKTKSGGRTKESGSSGSSSSLGRKSGGRQNSSSSRNNNNEGNGKKRGGFFSYFNF